MNYFKSFFKISIILLLLIISVGSIYAADGADSTLNDNQDDNFVLDEDMDDDSDYDDSDNSDDDSDEEDDDSDDDNDDFDDDSYDEDDSDEEYNESENNGFEFLEYKILSYLEKYGNCTDENWTESEDFLNEYQIYLSNPSKYTLNESAEGYQTYLKIYNSIVSTFGDYNLTENETAYLKFLIIYYLNHYGNVSADYTWNESDDFENFNPKYLLGAYYMGCASESASAYNKSHDVFKHLNSLVHPILSVFSSDLNKTVEESNVTNSNMTYGDMASDSNSGWTNIIILFLVLAIGIIIFRKV